MPALAQFYLELKQIRRAVHMHNVLTILSVRQLCYCAPASYDNGSGHCTRYVRS
jgi:hypothetical protein